MEIPAGRVESLQREFTVLSETDLKTPEQFAQIIIKDSDGYLVRLGDVARVELGADSSRFRARFNGKNAIPLGIVKQAVANPLEISEALQGHAAADHPQSLPAGHEGRDRLRLHHVHREIDQRGVRHRRSRPCCWWCW